MSNADNACEHRRTAMVWALRVILGAVFIVSGLAKSVDLWGTVYKIEEYLGVWGMTEPRTLTVVVATGLCGGEFLLGALLLLGCYRRAVVWLMGALMAFMLPLSLWLWIADPVPDCGCFGDFLVISNRATFWKNVAIVAGIALLWRSNSKTAGVITPYCQWMAAAALTVYILIVAMAGYNIQPEIDFRRFPQGTQLLTDDSAEEDDEEVTYTFIYSKGGEQREFLADNLPDSTWTFVDRKLMSGSEDTRDGFVILEDGEDITHDVINAEGEQMLVVVPEIARVNPSHTYAINTLDRYMTARGGTLTALLAPDRRGIDYWDDISMADYPVYTAEPTMLKELVRGTIGLVYLLDGRVVWKRTLSSTDMSLFENPDNANALKESAPATDLLLRYLSLTLALVLAAIIAVDRTGWFIHRGWQRRRRRGQKSPVKSDKIAQD